MGSSFVAISLASQAGSAIPRNAHEWRAIADFLDVQWLASLGLRRVGRHGGERQAKRADAVPLEACFMGSIV